MLFDIHTEYDAQQTLQRLTGIPIEKWEANINLGTVLWVLQL